MVSLTRRLGGAMTFLPMFCFHDSNKPSYIQGAQAKMGKKLLSTLDGYRIEVSWNFLLKF